MEDDEEIQSHPSGESGSPTTPSSNGRIAVTVAAVPPPQGSLTLALPFQQQQVRPGGKSGGGGGGGGREDCWSEGATAVLIDAWGERYLELSRGNLKQNHWKDVAEIVNSHQDYAKTPKTDIQCKNRIDTVKKKYKTEKAKIAAGGGPSRWQFFDKLDRLIGSGAKISPAAGGIGGTGTSVGVTPFQGRQTVPMGIPLGVRAEPNFRHRHQQQMPPIRKRAVLSDNESEPELSPESADDFPPVAYDRKRPRNQNDFGRGKDIREKRVGREKNWLNSVRDLAGSILKFGEAYEQAESSKLQQLVDMEKQRMKFAKELELQRMQFFMKTQLELSQLNHKGAGNSRNHRSNTNTNTAINNNNLSDSSS